ncbi:MAG: PAS domain-containing protein [Halobacteriales archaeon]
MPIDGDELLDAVMDAYLGAAFVIDRDGRYVEVIEGAPGSAVLFDRPDALRGRRVDEVLPSSVADAFTEVVRSVADSREAQGHDYALDTPSGRRHFEATVTPLAGTDHVLWLARDVTDRHSYERSIEALHEYSTALAACKTRQAVYDLTLETARSLLEFDRSAIAIERDGRLEVRAMSEEIGVADPPVMDADEGIAGRTYTEGRSFLVGDAGEHPDAVPQLDVAAAISVPLGEQGILQVLDDEPETFDEDDLALAELLAEHAAVALDRIDRERELVRYRTIVETIPMGVFVLDEEATILNQNERSANLVGYEVDELIGENFATLVEEGVVPEAAVEEYLDGVRALLSSDEDVDRTVIETEVYPRDGGPRVVRVHMALLPHAGSFEGTVQVFHDITDQRERERELERQNDRLEQFASIVSHDLRNPLSVAMGHLEMLDEDGAADSKRVIAEALERMETLIDDTQRLARQGRTVDETELVDVGDLAHEAWTFIEAPDARLVAPEGLMVDGDPARLRQVLENLLKNAVAHGGSDVAVCIGALPGGGFYVEDDGPGVPEDERASLFEPGYTTRDDGSGFGLAIVREIVEAHGWSIEVTEGGAGGARVAIRTAGGR